MVSGEWGIAGMQISKSKAQSSNVESAVCKFQRAKLKDQFWNRRYANFKEQSSKFNFGIGGMQISKSKAQRSNVESPVAMV
jgi:hypothetical protein